MRCAEIHPNLATFVMGGLEPEEATEVRSHLATCLSSRKEFEELETVSPALQVPSPPQPLPTSRSCLPAQRTSYR
jgi:anti-sigma factor RsiW